MTSKEFVIWLKGFTEGVHEYNATPKQWDLLKEKLAEVNDNRFIESPGMFQVHPEPPYPGPFTPVGTSGDWYPWGGQVIWGSTLHGNPLTTSGYIAPVSQSMPSSTVTTGSSSTYTFPSPGATITYTVSSGSVWGFNSTISTSNAKTLLHD